MIFSYYSQTSRNILIALFDKSLCSRSPAESAAVSARHKTNMESIFGLLWNFLIFVYFPLSLILYFFPGFLHHIHTFRVTAKPSCGVKIIAHRGGK